MLHRSSSRYASRNQDTSSVSVSTLRLLLAVDRRCAGCDFGCDCGCGCEWVCVIVVSVGGGGGESGGIAKGDGSGSARLARRSRAVGGAGGGGRGGGGRAGVASCRERPLAVRSWLVSSAEPVDVTLPDEATCRC